MANIVKWGITSIIIAVLIYAFYFYFIEYHGDRCCTLLANQIRRKLIKKITEMPIYDYEKLDKGTLYNVTVSETLIAAVAYFNNRIMIFACFLIIIMYLAVMLYVCSEIFVITLLVIPLFVFLSKLNHKEFKDSILEERKNIDEVVNCYDAITKNKKEIKLIGKEQFFVNKFTLLVDKWGETRIRYNFLYTFLKILPVLLNQTTVILLYMAGAIMVSYNKISMGELILMSQVMVSLFQEIANVVDIRIEMKNAVPLFERINKILDFQKKVINNYQYGNTIHIADSNIYVEKRKLFHIDNFSIDKNGLYVLMADNGKGKSYFMDCIKGIYPGIQGGDRNIVPRTDDIGMFSKSDLFIEETALHNIFLEGEDDKEYEAMIKEIFHIDFIGKQISVSPINLSLGEQQKILLSRFIWYHRDKNYWILDEPLVNLDIESAERFAGYVKEASQSKKIIVISHDTYFSDLADCKYKIENGNLL